MLDILEQAQGGKAIANLARVYGISQAEAEAVVRAVLPEVARSVERNTFSRGGLADIVGALGQASRAQVLDDPSALASTATRQMGIGLLDQIFAGKDRSRAVAARAAASTGIAEAIIKQMLPVIISMIVSALAKGGGGALGDIIARIPGLGGDAPRPVGRRASPDMDGGIPPLPSPLPGAPGTESRGGFETGGGIGGGLPHGTGDGRFGTPSSGGNGTSPLPLPGDGPMGDSGGNPYGDLSDIIRKGGPAVVAGGGLFAIVRSLLGTLLGFQSRGIMGWLIRLIVMRWGWGFVKAIFGRLLVSRR